MRGETPRSGRLPIFDGTRTILPRDGRKGPAPDWPLPGEPTDREAQIWASVWRRPQALIWERDDLHDDVALYVRKKAEAELPRSSSASVDTVQKLADHLLLTVAALRRAGVTIANPDTGAPGSRPAESATPPASRGRFRPASTTPSHTNGSPIDAQGHRVPARQRFRVVTSPGVDRDDDRDPDSAA